MNLTLAKQRIAANAADSRFMHERGGDSVSLAKAEAYANALDIISAIPTPKPPAIWDPSRVPVRNIEGPLFLSVTQDGEVACCRFDVSPGDSTCYRLTFTRAYLPGKDPEVVITLWPGENGIGKSAAMVAHQWVPHATYIAEKLRIYARGGELLEPVIAAILRWGFGFPEAR